MAIPKPLLRRDLSGFRFECWFLSDDGGGSPRYFRNRTLALRDAKDRGMRGATYDIQRILVLTSDGRRGWTMGDTAYVRTHRTRAAEREARIARRVRAKQVAGLAAA